MALKQETRVLQITTPLGDDALQLVAFTGREELSRLFSFELQLVSDNDSLKPADLVGKNATWSIALKDGSQRFFNGWISKFFAGDAEQGRREYRLEMVPWLWFLTRTTDCRIFQQKSVPDILKQVFGDLGFSDFEINCKGNHPTREYCVQYRENDFEFVSRLMEEEGIFYFFKHQDGKHVMVIADQKSAYVDCAEKEVDYPPESGGKPKDDHITSWEHYYQFRTGKIAQTDYNFETPSTSLMTTVNSVLPLPGAAKFEAYEYPGEFGNKGDGDALTKLRMEEVEAGFEIVSGTSLCKSFTPGGKFKIRQHRAPSEENKKYVVTSVEHRATDPMGYESELPVAVVLPGMKPPAAAEEQEKREYENSFTCIPDQIVFRAERKSRRPFVQGLQTAVVVGPPGEEIYPDKYGRVKVQFHWDREGKRDDKSSCWVRVSQIHAGQGFGAISIPRIGEEVIVAFLEGDPDQPVIVGRLYHAENMPPFGLPASKTISGIKTKTYKGDGYNELVMDDTPGKELMRIHAQHDLDATIENDERRTVKAGKQTVTVKGDATLNVQSGNRIVTVESESYSVTAAKAVLAHGKSEGVSITGDSKGVVVTGTGKGVTVDGKGGTGVGIKGEPNVEINGVSKVNVKSPDVFIGDSLITIKGTKIELIAPGGSITIDGAGITISGNMVKASAVGTHEITGALVKIN